MRIHNKPRSKFSFVGKLKVGVLPEGSIHPVSLDYFRATGTYAAIFHRALGVKPSNLLITFVGEDDSWNLSEHYEILTQAGRRFAWGDGRTFQVWDSQSRGICREGL